MDIQANDLFTRRKLIIGLALGSVAAAAAAAGIGFSWLSTGSKNNASWWDRTFVSLRNGTAADWLKIVGESFTFEGEGGPSLWKVTQVRNLSATGRRPKGVRAQAFAVVFQSSAKKIPAGNTAYTINHPKLPPLPIFVGKASTAGGVSKLTAIFN
ncbi:MAG: hypothetical protein E6G94_06320 [Alphaproteobacteria bacterium]|nr:MAG: hypothetical protein E6G94_06320 [Alphaproteobacteria bacterium]